MSRVRTDINAINPNPCTLEDLIANAQTQSIINNNISNTIGTGTGDTYKVGVDATDVTNATVDFLHAKINDHGTPSATASVVVKSQTIGHLTEQFFLEFEDIPGYDASKILSTDGDGAVTWGDPSLATDSFMVLVSGGDTTPSFLHAAINDNATYASTADIVVASATVGLSSTDQKERFFVDVSAIPGYNAVGTFALCIVNNVSQYLDISGVSDTYTVKCTANDSVPSYLHTALVTGPSEGYVAGEDAVIATQTIGASGTDQKEQLFLNVSQIDGYGDIGDGDTFRLSLTRTGTTYALKWIKNTEPTFTRVKTKSAFGPATGDSVASSGTGTVNTIAADGTKGPDTTLHLNYADEIGANIPGWQYTDTDGYSWLINVGCNTLVTS